MGGFGYGIGILIMEQGGLWSGGNSRCGAEVFAFWMRCSEGYACRTRGAYLVEEQGTQSGYCPLWNPSMGSFKKGSDSLIRNASGHWNKLKFRSLDSLLWSLLSRFPSQNSRPTFAKVKWTYGRWRCHCETAERRSGRTCIFPFTLSQQI